MWRKIGSFVGMLLFILLFENIAVDWFVYEAGSINWSVALLAGINAMIGVLIGGAIGAFIDRHVEKSKQKPITLEDLKKMK